jgi:hypothetical protein
MLVKIGLQIWRLHSQTQALANFCRRIQYADITVLIT